MKQAFAKKGIVIPVDVPEPGVKKGFIKIKVAYSAVSAGTEMTSVKGSGKSMLSRAIDDPAQVLKVLQILKTQGLKNAKGKVASAADKLSPIGYSISGEVIEVGEEVDGFAVGDLVSAGGSGFAVHAGIVTVPKNLVVKIPNGLDMLSASTGTVGSIALHGVRRADLKIGEYGVVFGVGLLGLLAIQILKASGVRVACVDLNASRLELASQLGADLIINPNDQDAVLAVNNWTCGYGADSVLFMAATDKDEPLSQAFRMCRRKGKVVMVGVSGMNINRGDIYANEIDFNISTSYGPGRYDSRYELEGIDYPYAYVRWTEGRNIGEFLRLIHDGKVNLEKIKPVVYSINDVESAYQNLEQNPQEHILTVLDFSKSHQERQESVISVCPVKKTSKNAVSIGLIGAGSFATSTLLPIIYEASNKFRLKTIVDKSGDRALSVARQFKAEKASSECDEIFKDDQIDLVMICTQHNNHAELVLEALKHNKHAYVEKPLATTIEQLSEIEDFYKKPSDAGKPIIMVGFNRRFSVYANEIKRVFNARTSPMLMHYRMNAGFVPYDLWIHKDGGRIVGEGCHIIDLMLFLTGSKIVSFSVNSISPDSGKFNSSDNKSMTFTFEDGSVGVIDYFSCGSKELSKEYLEVHCDNKSVILDDYRNLKGFGVKLKEFKYDQPRKGHKEEWLALYDSLAGGVWPIDFDSMVHTTYISILASRQN
jgi:predicted dehydrogenase/threonine dehydrogenase-like Zn-dependent dehydrogenase